MRVRHLDHFKPVCPACRTQGTTVPVQLVDVYRELTGLVLQGLLRCSSSSCGREYPILDGIPLLVADLAAVIQRNPLHFLARSDLADPMWGLLGDLAGPSSELHQTRVHTSYYATDHWGDQHPTLTLPSAVVGLMAALDDWLPAVEGAAVDVGCATGRSTFELATRVEGPVLGIDRNMAMLRVAASAAHRGWVDYPVRHVGVVFSEAHHAVDVDPDDVDFWFADAAALPTAADDVALALSLNVLDCLPAPWMHLVELERVLRPGGRAVIATPFDWGAHATPFEQWLGGHSQRSVDGGRSEQVLRRLLNGEIDGGPTRLRVLEDRSSVPWSVRVHDRSRMDYDVHAVLVERT